nr:MFS transporter [Rubeoparvulum massiliense]
MRFRDLHPNIKIRIIQTFVSRFVGTLVFPFMAIYLSAHFGKSLTGILLLFNIIIGMLVGFYGGYYSDKFGRKKIMVTAETIRFTAFVVMAFANSPFFYSAIITFLMMTVNSICWGLANPASQAMLIDVSTPEQRKFMYSISYWANNLSMAIGGAIGAFLFEDYFFELLICLSVGAFISLLMIAFFIKESHAPASAELKEKKTKQDVIREIFNNYTVVAKDKIFMIFVLASMLILSLEMHLTNYIAIRLEEGMPVQRMFNWEISGVNMLGILRTENTILVVLLAALILRTIKGLDDRKVLYAGVFLFTAGYSLLTFMNNIWVLVIVMLFVTIGELMRVPVEQSYLASIPPDNARSSYMAVNGMTFNGSMVIASLSVTLGAWLPPMVMATLFFATGMVGIYLYRSIMPELEQRRNGEVSSF